jgi:hypothetical protein
MLKNKFISFILFFYLAAFSFAMDDTGYLSVSAGDSMSIYVDTTYAGNGSISYLELPVGTYTVHIFNSHDHSWSNRGITEKIDITNNDHIDLDLSNREEVRIYSLPFASKVYLGSELLGQTPLVYKRELIGDQPLRLENRGFEDKSFNLIQGEDVYKVSLPTADNQGKSRVTRMKDNQYQIKWYREGLIVTSLAASWASFYYKRQADEAYAKYQRASDSRDMVALYTKTQRYDQMAEIAIAVSATTLGTYLFLLLIN